MASLSVDLALPTHGLTACHHFLNCTRALFSAFAVFVGLACGVASLPADFTYVRAGSALGMQAGAVDIHCMS